VTGADYRHVACCLDGSEQSLAARDRAVALAELTGARLSAVRAAPLAVELFLPFAPYAPTMGDLQRAITDEARESLGAAMAGTDAEIVVVSGIHGGYEVCQWAGESGCDLLVATRHRGLVRGIVLGSFAGYLAGHAPGDVLLVEPGAD
jgi:nucleotide-binding universal stress UspA family protein